MCRWLKNENELISAWWEQCTNMNTELRALETEIRMERHKKKRGGNQMKWWRPKYIWKDLKNHDDRNMRKCRNGLMILATAIKGKVISGEEMLACNHYKGLMKTYAEGQIRKCSARFERNWKQWEPELIEAWMEPNLNSKSFGFEWHSSWLENESGFILQCCWSWMPKVTECACLLTARN